MNERPKHEVLRSLGAFMGGLGVLLAGIALLILAIRSPLWPVQGSEQQVAVQPPSLESMERRVEEMKRLMDDPRIRAAIEKLPPEKVEVKTELQPAP
jgi:hypothetical protein